MNLRLSIAVVSVISAGLVGAAVLLGCMLVIWPPSAYGPADVLAHQERMLKAILEEVRRCCPCDPHE